MLFKTYFKKSTEKKDTSYLTLEEKLTKNFTRAQKLLEEALSEPHTDKVYYTALLKHEQRLFRAISLLHFYLTQEPEKLNDVEAYHTHAACVWDTLGHRLLSKPADKIMDLKTSVFFEKKEVLKPFLLTAISEETYDLVHLIDNKK